MIEESRHEKDKAGIEGDYPGRTVVADGTYTLNLGGADASTSGEFTLFGVSGVTDSSGTYLHGDREKHRDLATG